MCTKTILNYTFLINKKLIIKNFLTNLIFRFVGVSSINKKL